ncbi:MAG: hypothetical protein RR357_06520 [Clostridia bacterium]
MKKNIVKVLAIILVVALSAVMFTACVPGGVDKAKEKMTEKGYTCAGSEKSGEGIVGSFTAVKGLINGEYLIAVFYDSAKTAKADFDEMKGDADKKDYEIKRSGKVLYYGTKQALKDFAGF